MNYRYGSKRDLREDYEVLRDEFYEVQERCRREISLANSKANAAYSRWQRKRGSREDYEEEQTEFRAVQDRCRREVDRANSRAEAAYARWRRSLSNS